MAINFPSSPSVDDTYTYLDQTWICTSASPVIWERSTATETGNTEGNTGEIAYYDAKGSIIKGATAFKYDDSTGEVHFYQGISADKGATFGGQVNIDDALHIAGSIRHIGDTNTKMVFGTGTVTMRATDNIFLDATTTQVHLPLGISADAGATFGGEVKLLGNSRYANGGGIYAPTGTLTARFSNDYKVELGDVEDTGAGYKLILDDDAEIATLNHRTFVHTGTLGATFSGPLYAAGGATFGGRASMTTLNIDGTDITATPAELNLIDGNATVGTTAVVDGAGFVHNAAGVMHVTSVQTLAAYLDDEITAMPNLTSIGGVWAGETTETIGISVNNGSQVLTTGTKGHRTIPYACDIIDWRVTSTDSGAIEWGINYCTYANFPTMTANSIHTSEAPGIAASGSKDESGGAIAARWTKYQFAAGDIIEFEIDSVATLTNCILELTIRRTG